MRAKVILLAMVAMAGALLWVGTGCEEASGLDGLSVTPESTTLGGASNLTSVVFTAAVSNNPLALPLEWRVSNSALGNIVSHSGDKAVYVANSGKKGNNVITVRDQYDNEGSAVVTQK
jgi:hypothetical protein